MIKKKKK